MPPTRTLRRAPLTAFAVALPLALAACGSAEATRGSVRDAVRDALADRSDPITGEAATDIAECVADGLFDPDRFSKDERNEATSAADGEDPDPELAAKVEALVDECERAAG